MLCLKFGDNDFAVRLAAFCGEAGVPQHISATVASILADVKAKGDDAVCRCAARFDGAILSPADFRVAPREMAAAHRKLSAKDRRALAAAAASITGFNSKATPKAWASRNSQGAEVGEKFDPIRRVGIYVPGGHAPLVSTVLMTTLLAKLAGCPEIAVFTPSKAGGRIAPGLLAALHVAGVQEVYRIGGVHAIGAMAYGTVTIPAVDKIFGPGNAYVCEAKRQVFGVAGIDSLPGPSELMVIADDSVRPEYAAADLLAQAEHGSGREKIYLVATTAKAAAAIAGEVARQAQAGPISEGASRVLREGFLAVEVDTLAQAAEVANRVAPEHLELLVKPGAVKVLTRTVTTAGAIMIGNETATALGDFTAGPSHVLPTAGSGRFLSGLRVSDFLRRTSLVRYNRASLRRAAPIVAAFAEMEELPLHGRSVAIRVGK